ncbi:MAG: hypothetical protein ACK5XN_37650, partial [Bacteroidota bacterium]
MTNGKDLKPNESYAINQILIRKNALFRQSYRLVQANSGNYYIVNGSQGKVSYNTSKSQRILPEAAKEIMDTFKKRLGVDYQIITDAQAQNILKDKYNPAEGFYLHAGKVYVIEDNGTIDFETTIHEFGHPFMRALRAYNPALFANIVSEISDSKEAVDIELIIKNDYKEWFEGEDVKPQHLNEYLEELAVRGLTLYAKENFNPETGKPFKEAMHKLIRFLTTMLKDLFGKKELKLAALSPNTTLKELADIFSLKQGDINLEELSVLRKPTNLNEIKYNLKTVEILSSDKAKQIFAKGETAGWDLNKTLTELQIPKEQKELILSLGKTKLDDIITDLLANYSYAIEINTAIEKGEKRSSTQNYFKVGDNEYGSRFSSEKNEVEYFILPKGKPTIYITEEEYNTAWDKSNNKPTQIYSNLTVPGGTNYTEQEIATPAITPAIKGHAQFAT